jgi:hypothetical protein
VGVAALAPASNLADGLKVIYALPTPFGDLGAFYPLFCNGVFGGDPSIDKDQIFQEDALKRYMAVYDTKARAELSEDPDWMERAPLNLINAAEGIFRTQFQIGNPDRKAAWDKYWAQVEGFNPEKLITVPIRISQALGDTRVQPANTEKLIGQLEAFEGHGPITPVTYPPLGVAIPDPETLGDHFGLLIDDVEIGSLIDWIGALLIGS